jgi:APA family basic amino acid/polyamine antiporter
MARDGLAMPRLTAVHPVRRTPTFAIWSQALWSIGLVVVLETFRDLTEFVVFAGLLFYALTVAAVYVLRARRPDLPRPHRCLGYPLTPAVFIAAALAVDAQMLLDADNRKNALIGLAILACGLPVYWLVARRGRTAV